eukprot:4090410-Amphidinium_carterae.1
MVVRRTLSSENSSANRQCLQVQSKLANTGRKLEYLGAAARAAGLAIGTGGIAKELALVMCTTKCDMCRITDLHTKHSYLPPLDFPAILSESKFAALHVVVHNFVPG